MKRSLFLLGLSSFSVVVFADSNPSVIKGDGYEAVKIPKGTFDMGCTKGDSDCYDNEKPVHKVTISNDFYIMKTEVTQGLYQKVMGSNPSRFKDCGSDCPVETVTWYDAVRFANALSKKEGLEQCYQITKSSVDSSKVKYYNSGEKATVVWSKGVDCTGWRLPTEAEWEYASRGEEDYKYAGSNNVDEVAWYDENSNGKTHGVGQKKPNGFGVYDMSGNVIEWCWDWYDEEEYSSRLATGGEPISDPSGPTIGSNRMGHGGLNFRWKSSRWKSSSCCDGRTIGSNRVGRGGSWSYYPGYMQASYRSSGSPADRGDRVGFRLVLTHQLAK